MHARGEALMCCASALEDVAIEVDVPSLVPGDAPEVRSLDARVERLTRLAPDVMQVLLSLPAGARMPFAAGQYLNIVLEDGQRRAFSFANPPQQETPIELHVRRVEGGLFTPRVFDGLKPGDILHIEGPHGRFTLRPGERPILFVAGATGFAPIRSIVEDAFARGIDRPMWLYWGVRGPADLYARAEAERWQSEHAGFHFVPVLSEAGMDGSWHGRTGPVHRALLEDFPDLAGHELYVCGSVQMVTSAVPDFLAHGLSEQACFSDAFQPAAGPSS
jgi:NAD(P)H-flavin reductase